MSETTTDDLTAPIDGIPAETLDALVRDLQSIRSDDHAIQLCLDASVAIAVLRAENEVLQRYVDTYRKHAQNAIEAEAALAAAMEGAVNWDDADGLRPCPFCGGDAEQHTLEADEFGNEGGDVIECQSCGASSHVEFGRKENLVSAWNARVKPNPAAQDRDALIAATARILSFEPGYLRINPDGSGYFCVPDAEMVFEDDRDEGPDGPEGSIHWIAKMDASEIVALRDFLSATQPQTDALAAVRREARAPLIAALRGCIETADMVAADLQDKRSVAGSDMNAASLMANNRAARAILAAAQKEAEA